MLVDLDVDVEHGDLAEELGELLLGEHVVLLDQVFPDVFFDLFLGLHVVGVGVHQASLPFLLFLLRFLLLLHLLANESFNGSEVALLEGLSQGRVPCFERSPHVGVVGPQVLDLVNLLADHSLLLVVEETVEHLVEIHLRSSLLHVIVQRREEVVQQVLVVLVEVASAVDGARGLSHHEHVIVLHSVVNQFLSALVQLLVLVENDHFEVADARLDLKEALEVLHRQVEFYIEAVENVVFH
mmetsp:Transcript_18962/g.29088  ORF Transcript_18962/g.29088 Transcript_18962/m.29088 type:complete len:240 (+) Transcript_18962:531-1250(+)